MSSIVNDDKKVIEEGRETLEQPDAPLADQIPQKLLAELKDQDIGIKVRKMWSTGNADRSVWFQRQREYLSQWDEFLETSDAGPFVGSSNLHLPIPFIVAKTFHSRMLQAIDGVEPGVKPRRADSIESAEMMQALLDYTLREWANGYKGVSDTLDKWVWSWVTTGVGIIKWRWDVQYRRFIDVGRRFKAGPAELVTDPLTGEQLSIPTESYEEFEQEVINKVYEGPIAEWVSPEDVLIIKGEGDPQDADSLIHRQFVTASDMWTLVEQRVFDEEAVKAVIASGENPVSGSLNSEIKDERARNAGKTGIDTEVDLERYEILEAYLKVDVDGSGILSDVVAWVHEETGEILRANYLHRIHKNGMRPFVKVDFYKRPGEEMGMGLIEVLHPLTKEMDAMHNIRIDFGMLSTMPFGFYRPASSIKPEKLKLEPGTLIPVDNPAADIVFPNMGNRTTFGFNEENALMGMVERMTGVSDVTLGIVSGSQGATRTATGTRALQQESNANLNVHLRRLVMGWKQCLAILQHMLQQRMPKGFEFRVTGKDGKDFFAKIRDAKNIAGDFDFEVASDSTQSNPTIQQAVASQILQLVQNPLFIQLGTVNAGNIYEAQKNFLKSMGVQDWSRFLSKPPEHQIILSPEEELFRVINGQNVPVLPQSDHVGFIQYWDQIKKSDELLGQYSREQVLKVEAQAQDHAQAQAALEQARAQAQQAQQQQINVQAGAPTGQNLGVGAEQGEAGQ